MQKIIQTRFLSFVIGLFICSSLSAQSYVDISLQQILSPDSVLFCTNKDVPVKVVIKLLDGVSIDSFAVSYQLDNRATIVEVVKKRLMQNDTFHYTLKRPLSKDSLIGSQSRLIVTVGVYNSNIDYSVNNNSQFITLRKSTPKVLPYTMNFEGATTPPLDWTGIKLNYYASGYGAYVKEYVPDLDSQNGNSLAFQEYNLPIGNTLVVKSPVFDLSNIDLPYLYLNRAYGSGGLDTFKIDITKDCGDTYQPLFRKGGSDLWTMETFRRDPYNREHWRRDSFNLQAFRGEKVQFRFTYTAKTNDILYLDEVKVANRLVLNKDLFLVRRVLPDDKPICPSDKKQTPVELVIKNNGATTTDTIQLAFRVNNGTWVRETLVKRLNLDDSLRYTFTQLMQIPDTGAVVLTLAIGQKNEQNTLNDTLKATLNVRREFAVPFIEGFETADFPPKDWSSDPFYFSTYGTTKQTSVIGRNGQTTSAVYFDDHGGNYRLYLTTAAINLKGVKDPYLAFDISASSYSATSLTVEVSTDCGISFQPIYYKSGDSIRTHNMVQQYGGPTAANQWRRDSVSLLAYKDKDVMVRFIGFNSFRGLAIYIDNIAVFNRNTPQKDAAISSIKTPINNVSCPAGMSLLPMQIAVSNTGLSAIDTLILSYKINNTPSVSDTVFRSLAFGETFIHAFTRLPNFPKGGNLTFFYTVKIKGDLDNRNDTLSNQVFFPTQNPLTFSENFESISPSTNSLPKEWTTKDYQWSYTNLLNSNGLNGYALKFPNGSGSSEAQVINTPYIDLKKTSKPYLTFDLAYARPDTYRIHRLKIEVSTDCGNTFRPTAYDKTKKALETFNSTVYYPQPLLTTDWRRDTVDLTAFKDILILIRFAGYSNDGAPLFIDNVKVEAGFAKDVSLLARILPDTTPVCYPQRGGVPVRLAIRNDGKTRVDTIKLSYRLDTEGVISQTFIKRLDFRDTAIFTFNQLMPVATVGNHNLTFSMTVNGDENSQNDTLKTTFRLLPQYKANIAEGLESANFPPIDWTLSRSDLYFPTWETARVIGSRGDSTTAAYLSRLSRKAGAEDVLTTYPVDLSSVTHPIALFDVSFLGLSALIGGGTDTAQALKIYYDDTLRVDISTDCGQTFRPTGYKKTKTALTTTLAVYGTRPDYEPRIISSTDWRRDTIDLSAYNGQVVQLRFVHITPNNQTTNALYLDNFQFINHEAKNLSLFNWVTPNESTILCNNDAFPLEVKLINEGRTRVDSFDIKYQLDNLSEVKEQALVSLNPKESKNYRFTNLLRGVKNGEHTLRVVIRLTGDTISVGDTLFRKFNVNSTYNVPVIETFEDAYLPFPPKDWQVQENNYFFLTNWRWGRGKDVNDADTYTATYFANLTGAIPQDALVTWQVNLKNMKNPYLVFDIAAYRHYLQDRDSLRIDYSTDCGYSYKPTAYNKNAPQLITDPAPALGNYRSPTRNQWRSDSVRLFNLKDSLVQFRFSVVKSFGLIIYLDNVRVVELPVSTQTNDLAGTPQYSRVFPNPSNGELTIELTKYFAQPIDCQLRNTQGQIIKRTTIMDVNQQNWHIQDVPSGVYFLYIGVNNQFEKHKIVVIK